MSHNVIWGSAGSVQGKEVFCLKRLVLRRLQRYYSSALLSVQFCKMGNPGWLRLPKYVAIVHPLLVVTISRLFAFVVQDTDDEQATFYGNG